MPLKIQLLVFRAFVMKIPHYYDLFLLIKSMPIKVVVGGKGQEGRGNQTSEPKTHFFQLNYKAVLFA